MAENSHHNQNDIPELSDDTLTPMDRDKAVDLQPDLTSDPVVSVPSSIEDLSKSLEKHSSQWMDQTTNPFGGTVVPKKATTSGGTIPDAIVPAPLTGEAARKRDEEVERLANELAKSSPIPKRVFMGAEEEEQRIARSKNRVLIPRVAKDEPTGGEKIDKKQEKKNKDLIPRVAKNSSPKAAGGGFMPVLIFLTLSLLLVSNLLLTGVVYVINKPAVDAYITEFKELVLSIGATREDLTMNTVDDNVTIVSVIDVPDSKPIDVTPIPQDISSNEGQSISPPDITQSASVSPGELLETPSAPTEGAPNSIEQSKSTSAKIEPPPVEKPITITRQMCSYSVSGVKSEVVSLKEMLAKAGLSYGEVEATRPSLFVVALNPKRAPTEYISTLKSRDGIEMFLIRDNTELKGMYAMGSFKFESSAEKHLASLKMKGVSYISVYGTRQQKTTVLEIRDSKKLPDHLKGSFVSGPCA